MQRSRIAGVALLLATCLAAAPGQEAKTQVVVFPFYGRVTGNRVRLRGGAGDMYAVLALLGQDALVKVNQLEGEWYAVEVPGGLALYVAAGEGDQTYLKEVHPGEGVVAVTALNLRGTPGTKFPPLGRLKAGDRVVILDQTKGAAKKTWVRILAPPDIRAWIHKDYVLPLADQKTAAKRFATAHVLAQRHLMESGAASKKLLLAREKEKVRKQEAKKVFQEVRSEQKKGVRKWDIAGLRQSLQGVRDAAPKGDPDRLKAQALLDSLQEWERLAAAAAELEQKSHRAEIASQEHFAEELSALRKELDKRARERARKALLPAAPLNGWVRRRLPLSAFVGSGPRYVLVRGETRRILLLSDRYDLKDYLGKMVLILKHAPAEHRPGEPLRQVKVQKLEILAASQ